MPIIVSTGEDTFQLVPDNRSPDAAANYTYYASRDQAPKEVQAFMDLPSKQREAAIRADRGVGQGGQAPAQAPAQAGRGDRGQGPGPRGNAPSQARPAATSAPLTGPLAKGPSGWPSLTGQGASAGSRPITTPGGAAPPLPAARYNPATGTVGASQQPPRPQGVGQAVQAARGTAVPGGPQATAAPTAAVPQGVETPSPVDLWRGNPALVLATGVTGYTPDRPLGEGLGQAVGNFFSGGNGEPPGPAAPPRYGPPFDPKQQIMGGLPGQQPTAPQQLPQPPAYGPPFNPMQQNFSGAMPQGGSFAGQSPFPPNQAGAAFPQLGPMMQQNQGYGVGAAPMQEGPMMQQIPQVPGMIPMQVPPFQPQQPGQVLGQQYPYFRRGY